MKAREIVVVAAIVVAIIAAVFLVQKVGKERRPKGKPVPAVVSEEDAAAALDISASEGRISLDDCALAFSTNPRPVVAFAITRFRVRAEVDGKPLDIRDGILSFKMKTPMGNHRYALKPTADGWYEARAVLPACPTGGKQWFGTFEGTVAGKPRKATFQFNVEPR